MSARNREVRHVVYAYEGPQNDYLLARWTRTGFLEQAKATMDTFLVGSKR